MTGRIIPSGSFYHGVDDNKRNARRLEVLKIFGSERKIDRIIILLSKPTSSCTWTEGAITGSICQNLTDLAR